MVRRALVGIDGLFNSGIDYWSPRIAATTSTNTTTSTRATSSKTTTATN